jgi:DNA-binding transcriptional regulator YiaG
MSLFRLKSYTVETTVPLARGELGRKQVLSVENWAEIRRLRRAEGVSISEIARVLGISRNGRPRVFRTAV